MSVVVIEKESRAGEGVSSRNSGVIHAGMYYPNKSLKTQFCISGNALLYKYAELKNINHRKIGKYIIATEEHELDKYLSFHRYQLAYIYLLDLFDKNQNLSPDEYYSNGKRN